MRRCSRDLETIVAKAMARDAAGRYATAAALAEDLRRFVEDRPIRARRISPAERLARWCRRNKVLAASIGVAAAALVAVAVLSLIYADRQARHAAEQAEANEQIRRLAGDLERRGKALESSLAESNSRLARLDLERGQTAFEKGQIGVGMLWTVESLRMATKAGDEVGKHVALANLSAWRRHYVEPKEVFTRAVSCMAFSPDGKTIVTGSYDKTARLWDAATGRPLGQPMEHSDSQVCRGVQPGWQGDPHRRLRQHGAAVGRRHRPAHRSTHAAFGPGVVRGVQPGWQDDPHRGRDYWLELRLQDAATSQPFGPPMEHSSWVSSVAFGPDGKILTEPGQDSQVADHSASPCYIRKRVYSVAFQPRWQDDPHRELGQDRAAVGRRYSDRSTRPSLCRIRARVKTPREASAPGWQVGSLTGSLRTTTGSAGLGRRYRSTDWQGPGAPRRGFVAGWPFSPDGKTRFSPAVQN